MGDEIRLTEDPGTFSRQQIAVWTEREHLARMDFLHDIADRCRRNVEFWQSVAETYGREAVA